MGDNFYIFCADKYIFLALVILIINVVYISLANYLNSMSIKYYREQREHNDTLISLINQTILGLKDVKTLNISNDLNKKYNVIYKKWGNAYYKKRVYYIYRSTFLKNSLVYYKECYLYFLYSSYNAR